MTEKPIFILGIQRGGTNQILNILRSHPDTCWPQGEFHEVFRPKRLRSEGAVNVARKLARYAPIWLRGGDMLDPDRPATGQQSLTGARLRAIGAGLEGSAAVNRSRVAAFKAALHEKGFYSAPAAPARLLCKVMNYNLALAAALHALYPEAVFVGVIRDGRAVCEGHIARGASVATAAATWDFVARQLIALEAAGLPLRTWRFEDLLADAEGTAGEIYDFCGLDRAALTGVCLQDKERIHDASGAVKGIRKVEHFYSFAEMGRHMRGDANAGALARLAPEARAGITERCRDGLAHFGYGDTRAERSG